MKISARNQISAVIEEIVEGAVNALVVLKTEQGTNLYAAITDSSGKAMQLAVGETVTPFFKASHVLIAVGESAGISARNKLPGTIEAVKRGAVNAEIDMALPAGDKITAIITNEAADDLGLKAGDAVVAIIKSTDVMIAK